MKGANASSALSVSHGSRQQWRFRRRTRLQLFRTLPFNRMARRLRIIRCSPTLAAEVALQRLYAGTCREERSLNRRPATQQWRRITTGPAPRDPRSTPAAEVAHASTGNAANGSVATYRPFGDTPSPLDATISNATNLSAGTATQWQPDSGLTLSLTGAPGITPVFGGIVAELRLNDTSHLPIRARPAGTFSDGIVAVWAEYDFFRVPSQVVCAFVPLVPARPLTLSRLPDHCWSPVSSTGDASQPDCLQSCGRHHHQRSLCSRRHQPDQQTLAKQSRPLTTGYSRA